MVSTRSQTMQTHLEDFATQNGAAPKPKRQNAQKPKPPTKSESGSSTKKRKAQTASSEAPAAKKSKTTKTFGKKAPLSEGKGDSIMINRAPVLHLWAASVTHFLYPSLPWSTCLSAGSAVSTICAVAKGRSIGTMPEKDESEEKQRKRQEAKRKQKDLDEIHVMQFKLKLKDGRALVGSEGKGKPDGEEGLKKKFGESYKDVKKVFDEALKSWEGEEDECSRKAFGWYEGFRPEVKGGQKGWGRKGELNLERVREVVKKE